MPPADTHTTNHPHPMLRLVNAPDAPTRHPSRQHHSPSIKSAPSHHHQTAPDTENTATITQSDPRWAFAVRVASHIEGGRAAILRPEKRERLLRLAANLGFSPFDAALIIAMVQDTARRGESQPGHAPLSPRLTESLGSMPKPKHAPKHRLRQNAAVPILQKLLGATIIATAMVTAAILWMQSGS